jgi:hypothetical protein
LHDNFKDETELDYIISFFKRSLIKKSLMTVEYNCSAITFLKYFEKAVLSSGDLTLIAEYRTNKKKFNTILLGFYRGAQNIDLISEFKSYNSQETIYFEIKAQGHKITM